MGVFVLLKDGTLLTPDYVDDWKASHNGAFSNYPNTFGVYVYGDEQNPPPPEQTQPYIFRAFGSSTYRWAQNTIQGNVSAASEMGYNGKAVTKAIYDERGSRAPAAYNVYRCTTNGLQQGEWFMPSYDEVNGILDVTSRSKVFGSLFCDLHGYAQTTMQSVYWWLCTQTSSTQAYRAHIDILNGAYAASAVSKTTACRALMACLWEDFIKRL